MANLKLSKTQLDELHFLLIHQLGKGWTGSNYLLTGLSMGLLSRIWGLVPWEDISASRQDLVRFVTYELPFVARLDELEGPENPPIHHHIPQQTLELL
mgnify:FL=1